MSSTFHFLQGVFPFTGTGLAKPTLLHPSLRWVVPEGSRGQVLYFRGGNSCSELVLVTVVRSGVAMRYFPIGARGDVHVPLRVVEDLDPGEVLEVHLSAPEGTSGTIVVDLGLVEV